MLAGRFCRTSLESSGARWRGERTDRRGAFGRLEAGIDELEEIQNGQANRTARRHGPATRTPAVLGAAVEARIDRLEHALGAYLFALGLGGDSRFREDSVLRLLLEQYRDKRKAEYRARQAAVYAERARRAAAG